MALRTLMLLDNAFTHDPRVEREIETLTRAGHAVTLVAASGEGIPSREMCKGAEVHRLVRAQMFDLSDISYRRRLARELASWPFDVLHCHDYWMLHLGAAIKRLRSDATLIYDSHELFRHWPINLPGSLGWWLRLKSRMARKASIVLERIDARQIDRLITVNDSLAGILAASFSLSHPPVVLRNVPRRAPLPVRSDLLRDALGIPAVQRIVACVSASIHGRTLNLERVIDEFLGKPDVALVVIGGTGRRSDVEAYARSQGATNVHFYGRVPPDAVVSILASADVGLVSTWNRRDLSYWYALDNKLFSYIAAGIPVLATAQPEYRHIVEGFGVGVCVDADNPGAYWAGFQTVLSGYDGYRRAVLSAREELIWEREEGRLLDLYATIEASRRAA